MNTTVLFILFLVIISQFGGVLLISRQKRNAAGILDILTNHAQPIHADVKRESGLVTPPKDLVFEGQSLRKSLPVNTRLDLVRAINRVITLLVLIFSAAVEFYPVFQNFYNIIHNLN